MNLKDVVNAEDKKEISEKSIKESVNVEENVFKKKPSKDLESFDFNISQTRAPSQITQLNEDVNLDYSRSLIDTQEKPSNSRSLIDAKRRTHDEILGELDKTDDMDILKDFTATF